MKKSKTKSMLSIAMVLALMFQIMQVVLGNYEVNAQDEFINLGQTVGTGEYQGITVNKTVTDYAEGKFNVKVEVEAANEPLQNNLDVVLLIDKSGSMAGDRIAKAKEAAKNFVDKLIVPGKDNIRLAVISFSREATVDIGLSIDVVAIKEKIDNIFASGATFSDLGLAAAHYELANSDRPDAQKLIVFIADGIPTIAWEREEIPIEKELQFEPYYTSWHLWSEKYWKRGYNGIKETNVKVSNKADASNQIGDGSYFGDIGRVARNSIITADGYKKKGMEIISLGLGMVSERERYFMKEASSSGNYYNTEENLDDLDKILTKINEDLITYKVRNGLIVDGEDFPARVKYGDLSEVQIKVINSATGTEESHTIKKSWVEDFSQFHFSGIYLKPGQKLIITYPAELLPEFRDGGMWSVGNEHSYFKLNANIKETMKLPIPLVSATISGSVTVIKTWSEEPSQDIEEVDVVVSGKITGNPFYEGTLKLKKSGTEWRGTLDGLTVYFNGKKIEYDIKEVDVPGYQPNYTAPKEIETGKYVFQIHNQKVGTTPSDALTVKVKKTWLGEMPNQLEVELYQNNAKIDRLIMKKPSDNRSVWDGKFENQVKRLDTSGVPYEYKIVEKMVDTNYSADNTEVILKEIGGGILFGAFTNRNIARVNIPVEKKWVNTPTAEQTPVKVSLYRTINAGQPPVKVAIEPITLDSDNGFKNVFDFMPVFDSIGENATGKRFIYSVKEEMDSSQFEVSISGDGTDESPFIITNTKKQTGPMIKDIEVAKIWRGQTATGAALALYNIENPSKTDQPIDIMILPTVNGEWEGKFENLPIYGDTGKEIKYSVKEVIRNQADTDYVIIQNGEIFPIYDRKYQLIESNKNGKWIFTNIEQFDSQNPNDEIIHLIVTKNWDNTEEGFKKEVEITLYEKLANQDMVVTDKKLFLNKNNFWTGKFENLPKVDREYFAFETKIGEEAINVIPEEDLTNYKIGNYQVKIERQKNNIYVTNTHADNPPIQEYIDVQVTKDWGNVSEGHRKDVEITLYLLENGILSKSGKEPLLLNQANFYKGVFADLPKKNSQGDELKYYVFETKIGDEVISFTPAIDLTSYSSGNYQIQILNNDSGQVTIRNNYTEQVLLPYNLGGEEEDEKEVEEDEIPQGNITDKPKDKDEPKDKDKPKPPEQGSDTANKPNTEKPDTPKDTSDKEEKIEDAQVPQDKPELPKTGSLGGEMYGLLGTGLIGLGKWMKKRKQSKK